MIGAIIGWTGDYLLHEWYSKEDKKEAFNQQLKDSIKSLNDCVSQMLNQFDYNVQYQQKNGMIALDKNAPMFHYIKEEYDFHFQPNAWSGPIADISNGNASKFFSTQNFQEAKELARKYQVLNNTTSDLIWTYNSLFFYQKVPLSDSATSYRDSLSFRININKIKEYHEKLQKTNGEREDIAKKLNLLLDN